MQKAKNELKNALVTIGGLQKQNKDYFHSLTSAPKNSTGNEPSTKRLSRLRRKHKQRDQLRRELIDNFNVDLAQIVSLFFDDVVQFAHLFLAEFVYSSFHSVCTFVTWVPNDDSSGESRPIRVYKGRVIRFYKYILSRNVNTKRLTNLDAPLDLTNQSNAPTTTVISYEISIDFFSHCLHEEALHGSLSSYSEVSMKNFIAESILCLNQSETGPRSVLKSSDALMDSMKGSRELLTRFSASCIQTTNTNYSPVKIFVFGYLDMKQFMLRVGKIETLRLKT